MIKDMKLTETEIKDSGSPATDIGLNETEVKILLVDDNESNLMSMEVALEQDNYKFSKAVSGREALRILLKEEDFSLILLDVKMPIMDGYETAELIYQRDKLQHIPIIFITAHDYEEAAMFKGYQAGAVDYIRKPFNADILRSKVAVFAELYRKNKLLRRQEEKLQRINEDLKQLNQDLEKRVLERTLELENLNHELKAVNVAKDKFLSVISHDLRNPLTALLASSTKLSESFNELKPEQVEQLSHIIYRTTKKVLDQLNDLIEWAIRQSKLSNFNPEKVSLTATIEDSLEILKPIAAQKDVQIVNDAESSIYVLADVLMLRSIIQNLITNAIKYSPSGSLVYIITAIAHDMVSISIIDKGIGMSADIRERLFDKTSNLTSVTGTDNETGSGLGLLLVNDFISQHGGSIDVESEPGRGTIFKFTLPVG